MRKCSGDQTGPKERPRDYTCALAITEEAGRTQFFKADVPSRRAKNQKFLTWNNDTNINRVRAGPLLNLI